METPQNNIQILDNTQLTDDNIQILDNELNSTILELYKYIVDFCKIKSLRDYETKKPLICYINRDAFIAYIESEISNS